MQIKWFVIGLLVLLFFCSYTQAGLEASLGRLQKIRKVIHETFRKFGHDPNSTILAKVYPEAVELVSKKIQKLELCYNSTFKGQKISIFEVPLGVVVYKFLKLYSHIKEEKTSDAWLKELIRKVQNLLRTIKQMAKTIIECVRNEEPGFEPTKIGINRFAVVSPEEFRAMYPPLPKLGRPRGRKLGDSEVDSAYGSFDVSEVPDSAVPETYDYRHKGVVSEVKNQGGGQTCYIFAAIGAIESSYMLAYNRRGVSFSDQDVLNCMVKLAYNSNPVEGGTVESVMNLAIDRGIIRQRDGERYFIDRYNPKVPPFVHPNKCQQLHQRQLATRVKGFAKIDNFSEGEMMLKKILFKYGPVTTLFRSHHNPVWGQLKGKFNMQCKASIPIDHSMLIIGWDRTHWIIKNSFGNDPDDIWGVDGYLYLNKKSATSCGVIGPDSQIIFPNVE